MAQMANIALDGGDPRLATPDEKAGEGGLGMTAYTRPQMRLLHDPSVTFAEYYYYAQKTRAEEDTNQHELAAGEARGIMSLVLPSKGGKSALMQNKDNGAHLPAINISDRTNRAQISDEEWTNASRAMRTATIGAAFYLITTDILGPFSLPYAFASTGYGPGVALYTVFGFMAGFSGYLLWKQFLTLDSYEFPIKSYGDLAFRLYGTPARYLMNILQAVQLICNVASIIISNGEALSEATQFKLCYAVCCLIWAIAGFFVGQIRTLQKFGWLANFAVWVNLLIIFLTMGFVAHSAPLYSASASSAGYATNPDLVTPDSNGNYPAVSHSAGLPDTANFGAAVNGLMQAVFSFGGAMLFPEFMSEMRRPYDFIKAMWSAQFFIYIVYMLYGLFFYAYQGQYIQTPSYLGISYYPWQTAGNVLAMVSALIAAALYGNIGVKVLYNNIGVEFLRAPPLNTRTGKIIWIGLIPVYWAIAYIIGAAIPDFAGFTSIISATCILHFTYTFPPFLHIAYAVKTHALQSGVGPDGQPEGYNPSTGTVTKQDSGFRRFIRGFFGGMWYLNVFNVLYLGGALATAGLGTWAAVENLILIYAVPQLNAYGCNSPLNASA